MKNIRSLGLFFILLLMVSLLTSPTEGSAKWWDKLGTPEYGGTFTTSGPVENVNLNLATPMMGTSTYWCETLFCPDWTLDPDVKSFDTSFVTLEYFRGLLAESWEQTYPLTLTVHNFLSIFSMPYSHGSRDLVMIRGVILPFGQPGGGSTRA